MNFVNLLLGGAGLLNFNLTAGGISLASFLGLPQGGCALKTNLPQQDTKNAGFQQSGQPSPQNSQAEKQILWSNQMRDQPSCHPQDMTSTLSTELLKQRNMLLSGLAGLVQSANKDPSMEPQENHTEHIRGTHRKKIAKVNSVCGHDKLPHYAKGMCNNCYHRKGRTKKPWNCPHEKMYAVGMCQNCYTNNYNKVARRLIQQKRKQTATEEPHSGASQPPSSI